jgi:hypothetical protein
MAHRTRCPSFSFSPYTTHSHPQPSWRTGIRHPLHRQRTTSPVVAPRHREQSERLPLGFAPASLRVIARNEAIQTKSERRRPVALAPGQPPQAADGNGTFILFSMGIAYSPFLLDKKSRIRRSQRAKESRPK